jgi:hypothetical protein
VAEIVLGIAASGVLALTGVVGRRILAKVDRVDEAIRGNGTPGEGLVAKVAVIESKLPNGEWREIQADIKGIREHAEERVEHDIREHATIRAQLEAVHTDLKDHIEGEPERMGETVRTVLARRKNYTRGSKRTG